MSTIEVTHMTAVVKSAVAMERQSQLISNMGGIFQLELLSTVRKNVVHICAPPDRVTAKHKEELR